MTREQFASLKVGSIVREAGDWRAFVVTAHYGTHVTAVRTVDVSNPREWDAVAPDGRVLHEGEQA